MISFPSRWRQSYFHVCGVKLKYVQQTVKDENIWGYFSLNLSLKKSFKGSFYFPLGIKKNLCLCGFHSRKPHSRWYKRNLLFIFICQEKLAHMFLSDLFHDERHVRVIIIYLPASASCGKNLIFEMIHFYFIVNTLTSEGKGKEFRL